MKVIALYYELKFELDASDFRVNLLQNRKDEKELNEEVEQNKGLRRQIEGIWSDLSIERHEADSIRIGFIHVSNGILKSVDLIGKWNGYYPDLDQGMVISGYLFGKILDDYKTVLVTEGNYNPLTNIYMSQREWPFYKLKALVETINREMKDMNFMSQMAAIEYFERIKDAFLGLIDELREQQLI